jgi:pyrroline-5-carboxylate reductase
MSNLRVGFIGAGKMASALANGLITAKFVQPDNLYASDVLEASLNAFVELTNGNAVSSNQDVVDKSDVVILAVKPHQVEQVAAEIASRVTPERLVISIAAGVKLETYESQLGSDARIVRAMPNTPSLVSCGAAAFSRGGASTVEDGQLVQSMLATVGVAYEVPEHLLDAVTGLSGSGPAFVYQFIEALSDGGVRVGLPRDIATSLAAQTVMGAAKMVLETGQHPGVLKDMVTSPGGTTIAGIHELENGALRGTVMNAVTAATDKARELGSAQI